MTFYKPENITYTQMAQWIDSVSIDECNQELLVEYLYHLCIYNAKHHNFFNDAEAYDDFALFCASKLLIRLNNTSASPVKSIVNYIKVVLEPWHAEYVRCFCSGSPDLETYDFNVSDFADYLIDMSSKSDYSLYNVGYINISEAIRAHLKKIPRKKHSAEWSNIYLSCLFTLQDRIDTAATLCSNIMISREPMLMNRVIRSLRTRPPILFHIEDKWSNLISVLVNELIHVISNELSFSSATRVTPSLCLQNLVIAAANDEES